MSTQNFKKVTIGDATLSLGLPFVGCKIDENQAFYDSAPPPC